MASICPRNEQIDVKTETEKSRDAQQVERQQRIGFAQLAADEEEADDEQCGDAGREDARIESVRESLDRSHQQPERECVHHRVAPVEAVGADRTGLSGRKAAAQRQGDKPDGNVHGEEPRPVGDRKDACGDGRACDRRHGDDRGVETQSAAQPAPLG